MGATADELAADAWLCVAMPGRDHAARRSPKGTKAHPDHHAGENPRLRWIDAASCDGGAAAVAELLRRLEMGLYERTRENAACDGQLSRRVDGGGLAKAMGVLRSCIRTFEG